MKTRDIPVGDITVRRGRRKPEQVEQLAESIRELGLLNPITVTASNVLVAGGRRLAAFRLLKRDAIPAHVVSLDELQAELAEIDENFVRQELTKLERGDQLKRRKEIHEALHPETKKGGDRGNQHTGGKPRQSDKMSFSRDTALKTGASPRTIQREVQIAEKIAEEVKEVIRGTPIENRQADLEKLARIKDKATQRKVAEAAVNAAEGKPLTIPQAQLRVRQQQKREELKAKAEAVSRERAKSDSPPPWEVIRGEVGKDGSPLIEMERGVRLVFADPPYNIGFDYGEGHDDLLPDADYLAWCERWMRECADLLTPDGSMWVLINDEYAAEYAVALKRTGLAMRKWVIWYESFGANNANNFGNTHRHLFYFVRDPKRFVFNRDAVSRPSDRQTKYNDARANPDGKVLDDVWFDIHRVTGTAAERIPDFPTQLPLALLRRIVACCSEPGDLILDPFNGSGTTGVAAVESGRRYVGIERSKEYADASRLRLRGVSRHESR